MHIVGSREGRCTQSNSDNNRGCFDDQILGDLKVTNQITYHGTQARIQESTKSKKNKKEKLDLFVLSEGKVQYKNDYNT